MNQISIGLPIALFCAAQLLGPAPVSAQHVHTKDPIRVEVHGTLSGWGGIGAGARAEIVVAPEGAIDNVDDDISITAGGELLFYDFDGYDGYIHVHSDGFRHNHNGGDGFGIWPGIAAQWNFYLGQNWSVFPELGLWLYLGSGHYHNNNGNNDFGWSLMAGIGGRYHMASRNALMLRIQFPGLLQFGVTF